MGGYDPNTSKVTEDRMADFLMADITEDIQSVPGIGPSAKEKLAEVEIKTTYQLIGQFLLLKSNDFTTQDHCDAFWYWLKEQGINSYRGGIIESIAEKLETMMPGVYNHDELTHQKTK